MKIIKDTRKHQHEVPSFRAVGSIAECSCGVKMYCHRINISYGLGFDTAIFVWIDVPFPPT